MNNSLRILRNWLFAAFLIAKAFATHAQAPNWQAAVALNGLVGTVAATATDAAGNVYILTTGTLAKWSPASNSFVWTQPIGGAALVLSGPSIYITGTFQGPYTVGSTTLPGIGGDDVFVAKFTDSGTFVWAQQAGGINADAGTSVVVVGGAVYVAGTGTGTTTFGGISLVNTPSRKYAFVAKLNDTSLSASFTWAEGSGGNAQVAPPQLAENGSSVYLAGRFGGTIVFGGFTVTNTSPSGDLFVFKLATASSVPAFVWAQQVGDVITMGGITLGASGTSVYLAGTFYGSTTIGGVRFVSASGAGDILLAKLTDAGSSGSFTWALRAGGPGFESLCPSPMALIGSAIYLPGSFGSTTADFGSTVLTNTGSINMFVTKITDMGTSGRFVWAQKASGVSNNSASAVALGTAGRVYVIGDCTPSTSFGTTTLTGPVNTPITFLAALTDPTLTATTAALRLESIILFPNPAHNRATVQLPATPGPATLTLLDALGRTLRIQPALGSRAELDLSGLAPGLYAVRVAAGGATATRRLVVE